jgi:hypothetical protein
MSADDVVRQALLDRAGVSLTEVVQEAAALHRVDRKYVLDADTADHLLRTLPASYRVLEIAGRRHTTYRSTYFDTEDLGTARAHLQRRRLRWKARSRLYVEDGLCRLEVKTKDGRGGTLKSVVDVDAARHGQLDDAGRAHVAEVLAGQGVAVDGRPLAPTAEIVYRRTTLADTAAGTRLTLDVGVRARMAGGEVWLDPGTVLVETKSGQRPSAADRVLLERGLRPTSFSKYVAAASLLDPRLPDNDVRRLRGRVLHARPADAADRAIA